MDNNLQRSPGVPVRLAPFLAQWDYFQNTLYERLEGLDDEEYLWEPAPRTLSVRLVGGVPKPDQFGMEASGRVNPPRTIAWSIGHLGDGVALRANYLVGDHRIQPGDLVWPMTAAEGLDFLRAGLTLWREGLDQMTDTDLDAIGRSANPWGLDPTLPLMDIVWWVNKELIYHASEIWLLRDVYAARSEVASA
jgi:hypothetical protein